MCEVSPLCGSSCVSSGYLSLNCLPHWEHFRGFSLVWVLLRIFRVPFSLNCLQHWKHLWDFSPVWVILCLFTVRLSLNCLPHWEHLWGFSPICLYSKLLNFTSNTSLIHLNDFAYFTSFEWGWSLTFSLQLGYHIQFCKQIFITSSFVIELTIWTKNKTIWIL